MEIEVDDMKKYEIDVKDNSYILIIKPEIDIDITLKLGFKSILLGEFKKCNCGYEIRSLLRPLVDFYNENPIKFYSFDKIKDEYIFVQREKFLSITVTEFLQILNIPRKIENINFFFEKILDSYKDRYLIYNFSFTSVKEVRDIMINSTGE